MSYSLTRDEFEDVLKSSGSAVLYKKIPADVITPILASLKIFAHFPTHHFLLESVEKGNNKGRFSVIGLMPDLVWKCVGDKSFINSDFAQNPQNFSEEKGGVFDNLRALINASQIKNFSTMNSAGSAQTLPAIASGIFGYLGYDMVRLMEKVPNRNLPDELQIPDSIFIRPQIILVFDNFFDHLLICAPVFAQNNSSYDSAIEKIKSIEAILSAPLEGPKTQAKTDFQFSSNCTEQEYCDAVLRSKKYITDGDIFQVLPSQRFTSDFDKNLSEFAFYRALRSTNPSPFLFYLKFDDFVLTGSSPEIMVSLKADKVTVRPLAGTRKRGKDATEDQKNAAELLADEKEIAEHLMLIDLARHDAGRVSQEGSVTVTEKMVIELYSHVMHISSNVEGKLKQDCDALDALISGFPAGTVSGAPKIRAIEIIEEIEKVKRSFYAGCVGYFAGNGDMETCITLRSALIKNGKIYLQSGAGVVFDSNPQSEFQECLNKAQALIRACERVKEFC